MKAFKCDICGVYYEPYNYYGNKNTDKPNTVIFCRKAAGVIPDNITGTFDACPVCMEAIQSLINERKRIRLSIGAIGGD